MLRSIVSLGSLSCVFLFSSLSFGNELKATCRIEKPWLSEECLEPNPLDPNTACRQVAKMKAKGWTYQNAIDHNRQFVFKAYSANHDHLQQMWEARTGPAAWEICNSVVEMQCRQSASGVISTLTNIMSRAYTPNSSGLLYVNTGLKNVTSATDVGADLKSNYSAILDENKLALEQINNLLSHFKNYRTDTKSDLVRFQRDLLTKAKELQKESTGISGKEEKLLAMIEGYRNLMRENSAIGVAMISGLDCGFLVDDFAPLNSDLKSHYELINVMKSSLTAHRYKRDHLLNLTVSKLKLANEMSYAAKTNKELGAVRLEISEFNYLDNLLWEISYWWAEANEGGLAKNEHRTYFRYVGPLRILRSHEVKLSFFRSKVENSRLSSDEKALVLEALGEKERLVKSEVDFLVFNGWQQLLKTQLTLADKRSSLQPQNVICQKMTAVFRDASDGVRSLADYESNTDLFKSAKDACLEASR